MSKKDQTETNAPTSEATTETATDTPETGKRAKAPAGSSLNAQAKKIILAVAAEIAKDGGIMADTVEWIQNLATEFRKTSTVGLSLADKLTAANEQLEAVFASVEIVNNRPSFTTEQKTSIAELETKIRNLTRAIAKQAETAGAGAESETPAE